MKASRISPARQLIDLHQQKVYMLDVGMCGRYTRLGSSHRPLKRCTTTEYAYLESRKHAGQELVTTAGHGRHHHLVRTQG